MALRDTLKHVECRITLHNVAIQFKLSISGQALTRSSNRPKKTNDYVLKGVHLNMSWLA